MIHEYWKTEPNVHPSIYPKLIELWNRGPRHYRNYLQYWNFTHGECEKILDKIQEWSKLNNKGEYLNEY